MDGFILKILWSLGSTCLLLSITYAQDPRSLPVSRHRRLPQVIITREHLRQRQNQYGAYGDTAAEFVVSAGLDTSKNSAVRIRRIGQGQVNSSESLRPDRLNPHNPGNIHRINRPDIRLNTQHRTPSFPSLNEQNGIPNTQTVHRRYHLNEGEKNLQEINRRYHLGENEQRIRAPNQNFNRNPVVPGRTFYPYRPPIFVHNYQLNRRFDSNTGIPGENNRRLPNVVVTESQKRNNLNDNEPIYPIVSVKYSTSSVTASTSYKPQAPRPIPNSFENGGSDKRVPIFFKKEEINSGASRRGYHPNQHSLQSNSLFQPKPSSGVGNNRNLYVESAPIYVPKLHVEKPNKEDSKWVPVTESKPSNGNTKLETPEISGNTYNKTNDEKILNKSIGIDGIVAESKPVVEEVDHTKKVLGETPQPQSNINKIRDQQTRLIRKPSLILRDQITVNELPKKANRIRYGPRALELSDENAPLSRKKRGVDSEDLKTHDVDILPVEELPNKISNDSQFSNVTEDNFDSNNTQRQGRYDSDNFTPTLTHRRADGSSAYADSIFQMNGKRVQGGYGTRLAPMYEMFSDGTFTKETQDVIDENDESDRDVMSFSDFLTSPMADKIRLERQLFFRNANKSTVNKDNVDSPDNDSKAESSIRNSTMAYLRNLISARLLEGLLSLGNVSGNSTKLPKAGRSNDGISSSEQRHIGIMVAPYEDDEEEDSYPSKPVIRILKGRIISLPDLPPELIPIITGTYKPTYSQPPEDMYYRDTKLTENILDNAIYRLLKNDELLNMPVIRKSSRPVAYKMSGKSPTTKYVGSLKANEPMGTPNYVYKSSEWSSDPRCDRLTEEICLDDSDYPSSAIMSSIYKDKMKFDIMYAEVKVKESQVEGLSRQQETAYNMDHYYGSSAYPQASGGNMSPKEYAPPNGGFVCPSEVHYARPHRAKNRKAEWKVVVNVGEYTQTVRMEKCLASGSPCKYVLNRMQSTCAQVFSYHRLLVFSKEKGLHIDVFRVPTACTCYLRSSGPKSYHPTISPATHYMMRPSSYEEYGGHVETAPSPQIHADVQGYNQHGGKKDSKKNSFSNTLWAILGGGQQASALAQQPQFLDEVQKQITWTQQLNQYPHLMQQISPNQVLKQLLEEDEEDYGIRRQIIRKRNPLDKIHPGGFATHQVPMVVPLPPPPPPPPGAIPRRPVISVAHPDQKLNYPPVPPENSPSKIHAIANRPENTKVFSLTKDPDLATNQKPLRTNGDSGYRNIFAIVRPQSFDRTSGYKVHPGMYPPKSENVQVHESSLVPIAPQFNSHPDNPMHPIMKPMPRPEGSDKHFDEDEDLMAAEKSVAEDTHAYSDEAEQESTDTPEDDNDSKINFSYHPILEYLNL